MRTCLTVLALAALAALPAFPDIMDVSISGTVNINGSLTNLELSCQGTPTQSFDVTGTNSQTGLGTYSLSQMDGVNCAPPQTVGLALASADQTATISANSITLTNQSSTSVQGANSNNGGVAPIANASSTLTIDFDLSQPYAVDLTDSITLDCSANPPFGSFECPGIFPIQTNATGSIVLTGPGGNIPLLPSLTLDAGDYVLTVSSFATGETDMIVNATSTETLDAEFTPTPEPRTLAIFAIALLAALCPVAPFVSAARAGQHPNRP